MEAPGRLSGYGPIAIIDIGSNSVRLVVYERLSRSLNVLFNEKVLCGLGQSVAKSGKLDEFSIERTLNTLKRFHLLCQQMHVCEINVLATAAIREALNGNSFLQLVKACLNCNVELLSGQQEAYYSAYGIVSGFYKSDGIMGDLGGGSLELVDINHGQIGTSITLPIGSLRLQTQTEGNLEQAKKLVDNNLTKAGLLKLGKARAFYAIGGTWRSLAKLYMRLNDYPLRVIHHYRIPSEVMQLFCEELSHGGLNDEIKLNFISKMRRPLLPYGAIILSNILRISACSEVVVSALGVREGYLYQLLSEEQRKEDPLLSTAYELCFLRSRCPTHAFELFDWSTHVFNSLGIDEIGDETRLRKAACLLSDIGWRAHPDYRGEQSLNVIAHAAFIGIDHPGRAYLALAAYYRHSGNNKNELSSNLHALAGERYSFRAKTLAITVRLAFLLSASMPNIIQQVEIKRQNNKLVLILPCNLANLHGERLENRLFQLAKLVKLEAEIKSLIV